MSINVVTLSGRAGRDPEIKYLDGGKQVTSLILAVDQRKKRGEEQPPLWVQVSFWGNLAQNVVDYVQKGRLISVTGELEQPNVYMDKRTQEPAATMRVNANRMDLLGPAPDRQAAGVGSQPAQAQQQVAAPWDF